MTPQELKSSILELAIEGKLVSQLKEDGTTNDFLTCLEDFKRKQKNYKKIKSRIEDESAIYGERFEIPSTWSWVYLTDVYYLLPTGVKMYEGKKRYYSTGSIVNSVFTPEGEYSFYDRPSRANREHKIGDLLDAKMQGTIKTTIINDSNCDALFSTGFYGLRPYIGDAEFLKWLIQSPYFQKMKDQNCSGTTQKALNDEKLNLFRIPLPPIKEQTRIVAKIEKLLYLIDKYENVWIKLNKLNSAFPIDVEKSILQFAMKGFLVNHIENEGTGNDLFKLIKQNIHLKRLNNTDVQNAPFNIPSSWTWVRMGDILNIHSSKRVHAEDYRKCGVPFYRSLEVVSLAKGIEPNTQFFISEEQYRKISIDNQMPSEGDLLITCIGGSIGWNWIVDKRKFYYKDGNVVAFDKNKYIDMRFVKFYLSSPLFLEQVKKDVSGTAYNALTIVMLKNYLIPLPPLEEQKRIVAKIEELLPLCRSLQK